MRREKMTIDDATRPSPLEEEDSPEDTMLVDDKLMEEPINDNGAP
jgi:hypothetical protein